MVQRARAAGPEDGRVAVGGCRLPVAFLGGGLEWENGTNVAFVGSGVAAVIAAVAFMLRSSQADERGR